jgi:hypothetical protein
MFSPPSVWQMSRLQDPDPTGLLVLSAEEFCHTQNQYVNIALHEMAQ